MWDFKQTLTFSGGQTSSDQPSDHRSAHLRVCLSVWICKTLNLEAPAETPRHRKAGENLLKCRVSSQIQMNNLFSISFQTFIWAVSALKWGMGRGRKWRLGWRLGWAQIVWYRVCLQRVPTCLQMRFKVKLINLMEAVFMAIIRRISEARCKIVKDHQATNKQIEVCQGVDDILRNKITPSLAQCRYPVFNAL